MEQIESQNPDLTKIQESLSKIKARGLKQRLKKKVRAAGISLE